MYDYACNFKPLTAWWLWGTVANMGLASTSREKSWEECGKGWDTASGIKDLTLLDPKMRLKT